jgi:site-specific DNA-methyltransferase (adenine-specific)
MVSKLTSEHAGEPDSNGMYKVLSKTQLLTPGEVCTDSYLVAFPNENQVLVKNFHVYLKTKFARFLILQAISSINLSKDKFNFLPMQDFSRIWKDEELYSKYSLFDEEIAFIESLIRPMEFGEDING